MLHAIITGVPLRRCSVRGSTVAVPCRPLLDIATDAMPNVLPGAGAFTYLSLDVEGLELQVKAACEPN